MISSNKTKGFTLVELLIVIVVIAILAAISIVAYNGVTLKARDDKRVSDARNVLSAISSYHAETGEWLDAAKVTSTTSPLKTFTTIKVPEETLGKVKSTAPSPTAKDDIQLETCGTAPNLTGVRVITWSEAKGTTNDPIVAGNC